MAVAQVAPQNQTVSAFSSEGAFVSAQRMARALTSSTLVPESYRGEANIGNALIALELSHRIGASVMAVMQSMTPIHGRPSWSAAFLIATVNTCGRFSPLRFRWEGQQGTDAWGCRAYATERSSKEELVGSLITIALAKSEGWYGKNGSKWRTMPEQMLMYRAASFWTRAYAPELSLGMVTVEEAEDIQTVRVSDPDAQALAANPPAAPAAAAPAVEPRKARVGRRASTPQPIDVTPVNAEKPAPVLCPDPQPDPDHEATRNPEPEPPFTTQPEPSSESPEAATTEQPATTDDGLLSDDQRQVVDFVARLGASFDEFKAAIVANKWFPGCEKWESYADISDEICQRLLRAKHGVTMQIQRAKGGAK